MNPITPYIMEKKKHLLVNALHYVCYVGSRRYSRSATLHLHHLPVTSIAYFPLFYTPNPEGCQVHLIAVGLQWICDTQYYYGGDDVGKVLPLDNPDLEYQL